MARAAQMMDYVRGGTGTWRQVPGAKCSSRLSGKVLLLQQQEDFYSKNTRDVDCQPCDKSDQSSLLFFFKKEVLD
jgi:hypothetical protein